MGFVGRCSTPMAIVAFLLSVAALILAIVLPNQSQHDSHSQDSLPDKKIDCVNCANLLNEYINSMTANLDPVVQYSDTSGKPCCAEDMQQLSKLLGKILQVQKTISGSKQKENTNKSPTNNKQPGPVVAHKSFFRTTELNGICGNNKDIKHDMEMLTFTIHNESFEVVKQIHVNQDGLQIKYPGMYYVYSSFKFHSNKRQTKELKSWHQFVYRDRKGFCESLLKTTHTTCQDCQESKDTVFTGGVFYLISGDVLRVLISGQEPLDFKSADSYLGVLMLSAQ